MKNDCFDKIISALWIHRKTNKGILSGCVWSAEWTNAKDGIIDKVGTPTVGHAFAIIGQKTISGKPYLIIQNSLGQEVGQNGLHYMSREVANQSLRYGNFMFVDMPQIEARKVCWTPLQRLKWIIKRFLE